MYIMALQVWLPLNGNLKNQGLAGSVTVTNHGATVNSSGKIGSCYSFTTSQYMELNNVPFSNLNAASVCFWVKIAAGDGNWLPFTGQSTSYYILATSGGTGNFYHANAGSGTIYCDGVLRSSPINDGQWHHYCITNVNLSTWTKFYINYYGSTGSGWNFNGQMNDIRIYDHCLTPKEVHEISKALVLHYSLDNIQSDYSEKLLIEPDGSKWIHIFHHNNPASNLFSSSNTWANGVYESDDKWFNVYSIVSQLSSYEFLAKIRTTAASSEIKYRWVQAKSPLTATYNDVKPASVTRITTSGYTDSGYGGLYILNSNTHMVTANSSNGNWWGATGCWTQYSGGIPSYGGQVVTSGCTDLYVRIPDISSLKIFDNSGYQNNGTIAGSLQIVNSEARYRKCSKVTDTGRIIYPFPHLQVFSYSLWFKRSRVSYSNREMLGTGWYGISMELNTNNTLTFRHQLTSGTFDVISTATFTSTSDWYHITLTRDAAGVSKIYVNGVLNKSGTNTNQINYTSSTAELFTYSNTSYQFQGCISDFRIYATALSAADVAALHNVGAIIDNGSNMHTYEYHEIESTTPKVHRTGVTDSSTIIEPDTITNASFSKAGIIKAKNFYEI